ncbi:MAG: hypothetical protein KQH59_12940 [Desulfobulbaceae bacterium]|nr:hypothetical protein [Desulfobulbaceae bacterium]
MRSNDPIFNQQTTRDRLTEADAIRQGYGSAFDFLAVWNLIADYARKERLLKEPIRLNQLPAEAIWLGVKAGTLGIAAACGFVVVRLIVFYLVVEIFFLSRDMAALIYISIIAALAITACKTLADYLRYPGGLTDSLISITVGCLVSSMITMEVVKLGGVAACFLFSREFTALLPDSPYTPIMVMWFYEQFLGEPWKLVLEEWLLLQAIISGIGIIRHRRRTLTQEAAFDLAET